MSDSIKYNPGEMKFYQIDLEKYPELLNPQKTVLALFEYDEDGNEKKIHYQGITDELVKEHNQISDKVIQGYVDRIKQTGKPLLFLGVPHIMHAGSLDISNCPIIIV